MFLNPLPILLLYYSCFYFMFCNKHLKQSEPGSALFGAQNLRCLMAQRPPTCSIMQTDPTQDALSKNRHPYPALPPACLLLRVYIQLFYFELYFVLMFSYYYYSAFFIL